VLNVPQRSRPLEVRCSSWRASGGRVSEAKAQFNLGAGHSTLREHDGGMRSCSFSRFLSPPHEDVKLHVSDSGRDHYILRCAFLCCVGSLTAGRLLLLIGLAGQRRGIDGRTNADFDHYFGKE